MATPVKIFISYAREDQDFLAAFRQHLEPLVDHGLIQPFDDRQLALGDQWDSVLRAKLAEAELVIFLVSSAFVNSRYIETVELADAMKRVRVDRATCWLMPIVVRPVALKYTPLAAFKAYPSRGSEGLKPVSQWPDRDEAYAAMAEEIGSWAERQLERDEAKPTSITSLPAAPTLDLAKAPTTVTPASPAPRLWTPGQVFRDIDEPWCPELVVIPSGTSIMGSSPEEQKQAVVEGADKDWVKWEGPQRRVTIDRPFAMGKYAVTFAEFDEFVLEAGHPHQPEAPWGRGRMPVVNVSWEDAQAYCKWLSGKAKTQYRLPSEAEWEYACRAGTSTAFSFGATISPDQANYDGNSTYAGGKKGHYREKTVPVDEFRPNAFGLHQMHGNVWEWCEDPWHDSYVGAPHDGSVWLSRGNMSSWVVRGGSWVNYPGNLRAADRSRSAPDDRNYFTGFRVARTLAP